MAYGYTDILKISYDFIFQNLMYAFIMSCNFTIGWPSCYKNFLSFFSSPVVHSHMHFLFSLLGLHTCSFLRKISNIINKIFIVLAEYIRYYFYQTWNTCPPLHATNELWSVWSLRIKGLIILFWVCVASNLPLRNIKDPGMGEKFVSPISNQIPLMTVWIFFKEISV